MIIGIDKLMGYYGYGNKKAFSEYKRRHPDQFPPPLPGTKKWVEATVVAFIEELGRRQLKPVESVRVGRKRNKITP